MKRAELKKWMIGMLALGVSQAFSADLYVSLRGSNVIPYTSLATGARSIQTAIDAAGSSDTVWVGPGT